MPDDDETPDTYRPRRNHYLTIEAEAPHGEMRTLRYKLNEGVTYRVVSGDEADEVLGNAPVSNVREIVRASAIPSS